MLVLGHPYLTDVCGIPQMSSVSDLFREPFPVQPNPTRLRFSLKPVPVVGVVTVASGWRNPFPILVFAAFLVQVLKDRGLHLQGVAVWYVIQRHLRVLSWSWSCASPTASQSSTSADIASQ